jgi:hypothetical protein
MKELLAKYGHLVVSFEKSFIGSSRGCETKLTKEDKQEIEARAILVANSISKTTRKKLKQNELHRDDIESYSRAVQIATTEITFFVWIANKSVIDNCKGLTLVWVTEDDELVCPICGPLHLKPKSQWRGKHMPAHPGCRCTPRIVDVRRKRRAA